LVGRSYQKRFKQMIAILYSWRIKPDKEQQFIESWSQVTEFLRKNRGSLGSRLHRGNDGLFYGYAQWKSVEERQNAFQNSAQISDAIEKMRDSIDERFPEIMLEPLADFLIMQ
jgi:heme-degrading monooxygenase HmoA